ncbi:anti-phage protein KwaA [Succinispira mobilis]|uniref:anti-phage protein KwaA n=1 Tax=Succinispira mobilis TaxID=78120 RepID=UPI000382D1EB|nr:anti-phage protein KwaA [Succinispira mobilis]
MQNRKNNVRLKVKMYILSLWLLFCFITIATLDFKIICESFCSEKIDWLNMLTGNIIPIVCIIMLVLCIIFYFQFKHELSGTTQLPVKVTKVCNRNADYLAFLSTYIIPLVFVNFDSKRQVLILILLLISIGFMYVKTDMFLSNPTLALLGYKINDIKTENGDICGIMISQGDIEENEKIRYIRLDRNAFFVRKV